MLCAPTAVSINPRLAAQLSATCVRSRNCAAAPPYVSTTCVLTKRLLSPQQGDGSPAQQQQRTPFHGIRLPPIRIAAYLQRIAKYAKCSPVCFVMAETYLERLAEVSFSRPAWPSSPAVPMADFLCFMPAHVTSKNVQVSDTALM